MPFDGTANSVSSQSYAVATGVNASTGTAGEVGAFRATPSTPTPITAEVPVGSTGVFVSTTPSTLWSAGKTSVTVGADDTIYVFGTKAGVHNVTFTAGGKSVTIPVKVKTSADAAYNMSISPEAKEIEAGKIGTVTLKVTDVFGNPVQTTDDTGKVTIEASGQILLAGFTTSRDFTTDALGEAIVTIIAGSGAGSGALAAVPALTNTAAAWKTPYTPPAGAPAPVTSAAANVTVIGPEPEKAIEIVGTRGTVNGGSGVLVDGLTEGIDDGAKLVPYWRVPGTTYTAGNARPEVTDSEFSWQRKMGKTAYVFFTTEDGAVKSNRIIIAGK